MPPGARPILSGTIGTLETSRVAAVPAFADLPPAELEEVAGVMREVTYRAGFRVVTIEDYGMAVYAIEEGNVEVLPREGSAETLGPGDVFGEIALLLTGKRTATVVARTPVRLLALSSQSFEGIRPRVPELERLLLRVGVLRASR